MKMISKANINIDAKQKAVRNNSCKDWSKIDMNYKNCKKLTM